MRTNYTQLLGKRKRRGHALVEYAIILALVGGMVWCAGNFFKTTNHATWNVVGQSLGGNESEFVAYRAEPANRPSENAESAESIRRADVWLVTLAIAAISLIGMIYSRFQIHKHINQQKEKFAVSLGEVAQSRLFAKRQYILQVLQNDATAFTAGHLQVRHLMTKDLTTVDEATTIFDMRVLMQKNEMRHILVCGPDGELRGVVSDRDLSAVNAKLARDVMTLKPLTVEAHSLVSPAATMMIDRHISMLPVIEHGKLCGVITTTDLIMGLQCGLQAMLKTSLSERYDPASALSPKLADNWVG